MQLLLLLKMCDPPHRFGVTYFAGGGGVQEPQVGHAFGFISIVSWVPPSKPYSSSSFFYIPLPLTGTNFQKTKLLLKHFKIPNATFTLSFPLIGCQKNGIIVLLALTRSPLAPGICKIFGLYFLFEILC